MKTLQERGRTYVQGFLLSIVLTFLAYTLVLMHTNSGILPTVLLIAIILLIALIQLFVQLTFFLHLGEGATPKWNIVFFVITFTTILVVIAASAWIMNHLNYNMTPLQVNQYIQNQSGF